MMTHILSNLTEEYDNLVKNLEYELDDDIDMLTIERIWDKLSAKCDKMNAQSNQNEVKEPEKALYIHKIKGTCYNCGKYGHKSRDSTKEKKVL